MAEFGGYLTPRRPVGLLFGRGHVDPALPASERTLRPGQRLVAVLGVGMTEAMGIPQPGFEGVIFKALELLDVAEVVRNHRVLAFDERDRVLQHLTLLQRCDRHGAGPAALGPTALQRDVVSTDGSQRLEFQRLLAAQTERDLKQDRGSDVGAFNRAELAHVERLRAVAHGFAAFADAVGPVIAVDDVGFADLLRPPTQEGQAIADGGVRLIFVQPFLDQCFSVFRFQRAGIGKLVAEVGQFRRHGGEAALAVGLRAIRAITVTAAQPYQVHGEIVHLAQVHFAVSVDGRCLSVDQVTPRSIRGRGRNAGLFSFAVRAARASLVAGLFGLPCWAVDMTLQAWRQLPPPWRRADKVSVHSSLLLVGKTVREMDPRLRDLRRLWTEPCENDQPVALKMIILARRDGLGIWVSCGVLWRKPPKLWGCRRSVTPQWIGE